MDKYIVIIKGPYGLPMFLVDSNEEPFMFDSRKDAVKEAEANEYARARGYQVITWIYEEE